MRQSWNEYFMSIAQLASERATCKRLKVGCVIVRNNRIISQGYNGSIKGHLHCTDAGCLMHEGGCKRCIHAEMNAIIDCANRGVSCDGAEVYVTHQPCPDCTKALNQAGIKTIYYQHEYKHRYKNNFSLGMKLIQI